jgi:hypothetical protein
MFRTTANVTGTMAVAALLGRTSRVSRREAHSAVSQ